MIPQPLQQWQEDAAERKGYEKAMRILSQNKTINIQVNCQTSIPDFPRSIHFPAKEEISVADVLKEVHSRLPPIEHPYVITNTAIARSGPGKAIQLDSGDTSPIRFHKTSLEDTRVLLHLKIFAPDDSEPSKPGLGSKLRSAMGMGKNRNSSS